MKPLIAQRSAVALPLAHDARARSLLLALLVHGALFVVLHVSLQWQTKTPDAVQAELWSALPELAAPPAPMPLVPTPPSEAAPVLKTETKIEPSKAAKAAPAEVETPDPQAIALEKARQKKLQEESKRKNDKLAEQKRLEEERKEAELEAKLEKERLAKEAKLKKDKADKQKREQDEKAAAKEAEREAKLAAEKKAQQAKEKEKRDNEKREAQRRDEQETQVLNKQREEEMRRMMAGNSANPSVVPTPNQSGSAGTSSGTGERTASPRVDPSYAARVRNLVYNNLTFAPPPPDGRNPSALVLVRLLPDGTFAAHPQFRARSGNSAYDLAIERALQKTEPFPRPSVGEMPREIELTFRMYQ